MGKKIVIVQRKEGVQDGQDVLEGGVEAVVEAGVKGAGSGQKGFSVSGKGHGYDTFNSEAMNDIEEENFEELFEKSMSSFDVGELVDGTVVGVRDSMVFVDVGYKLEGKVRREEFEGEPVVGDKIRAMVMVMGDDEDNLILSKRKADMLVGKEVIERAYTDNVAVEGKILKEIKAGYRVLVSGMECFLPLSQVGFGRVQNPSSYVGKTFKYKVSRYEASKNNVVLSRKEYLIEDRVRRQDEFFDKVREGDIVLGVVKKIESYGAFVSVDSIDGFIHLKDLSWVHIKDCSEVFSEGDRLEFKIIKVNLETRKINLGLKQMTEDPWDRFVREHSAGDVVNGEVVRMANFGAFIKVVDGIDGLIHVKELSWTKRINHPREVLKIGDFIESKILHIDKDNRKLSLSLRDVLPNPWEDIEVEYPRGEVVEGHISSITAFGIFVELDKGIVGLLHKDNIDWTKKHSNPKQHNFKKGQKIKVMVLSSSSKDKSISLGLKQLLDNPWADFKSKHGQGSLVKGELVRFGDNGIYVKLAEGIEAFLHSSNVVKAKDQKIEDIYKKGSEIEAVVKHIDVSRNRINISVRDYEKRKEEEVIKKYVVKDVAAGEGATFGDFIKFEKPVEPEGGREEAEEGREEVAEAEAKADEAGADEAKAGEAGAEEAKADEAKADEAKAGEAGADEAKADEAKADEAKADEAGADEAKAGELGE